MRKEKKRKVQQHKMKKSARKVQPEPIDSPYIIPLTRLMFEDVLCPAHPSFLPHNSIKIPKSTRPSVHPFILASFTFL